jgi:hypothetical protein
MLHIRSDYNKRIQDSENIIPANEPVMIFRAQDKHMPSILRHYALLLRLDNNEAMAELVSLHILKVINWQETVKHKRPDCPQLKLDL